MVRHLRSGGMLGMLVDQHMGHGEELTFFDRPALTALSAAELALKYKALLVYLANPVLADGCGSSGLCSSDDCGLPIESCGRLMPTDGVQ